MNITVTFNDLDEVRAFAAMISGQTAEDKAHQNTSPKAEAYRTLEHNSHSSS